MAHRCMFALITVIALTGCGESPPPETGWSAEKDLGVKWVQQAAEYQALSMQAYHQAERDLPGFLEDRSWSAQPGQKNAHFLPTAIVFDVDETVISGVDFQLAVERPVTQTKLNQWHSEHQAPAITGFERFANKARAAGVELFFISNRPCERIEGIDDPCPYKSTIVNDIRDAGVEVDAEHVWLANEHEHWGKEKLTRREQLARTHRILMLIGDDLSDFIPCVRQTPSPPCTDNATAESRQRKVTEFSGYWGHGWYILPNPMHGSWTSFDEL